MPLVLVSEPTSHAVWHTQEMQAFSTFQYTRYWIRARLVREWERNGPYKISAALYSIQVWAGPNGRNVWLKNAEWNLILHSRMDHTNLEWEKKLHFIEWTTTH